jgi:hypothetical protein
MEDNRRFEEEQPVERSLTAAALAGAAGGTASALTQQGMALLGKLGKPKDGDEPPKK